MQPFERGGTARAFIFFEPRYRLGGGDGIDSLSNELADETVVAERLTLLFDVESRVETIVEKTFAPAALDRLARIAVVETFTFEVLPEAGLGATLPR